MWVDPLPCEAHDLPCRGSSHEFTMKKRKNEIGAGAGQVGSDAALLEGRGRGAGGQGSDIVALRAGCGLGRRDTAPGLMLPIPPPPINWYITT